MRDERHPCSSTPIVHPMPPNPQTEGRSAQRMSVDVIDAGFHIVYGLAYALGIARRRGKSAVRTSQSGVPRHYNRGSTGSLSKANSPKTHS